MLLRLPWEMKASLNRHYPRGLDDRKLFPDVQTNLEKSRWEVHYQWVTRKTRGLRYKLGQLNGIIVACISWYHFHLAETHLCHKSLDMAVKVIKAASAFRVISRFCNRKISILISILPLMQMQPQYLFIRKKSKNGDNFFRGWFSREDNQR